MVKNRPPLPILWTMRAKTSNSTWLRVQQAADLLGVSANTVRRWADSGRLVGQRSPSDQRRFLLDDVEALMPRAARDGASRRPSEGADQRYRLLFETSIELASTLELDEVLQSAARRLSAALDIPDCDIYRFGDDGHLVCLASSAAGVFDESWAGRELYLDEWPCYRVALETRRAVSLASLDDPRLERDRTRRDAPLRAVQFDHPAPDRPRQGHRPGRPPRPHRA